MEDPEQDHAKVTFIIDQDKGLEAIMQSFFIRVLFGSSSRMVAIINGSIKRNSSSTCYAIEAIEVLIDVGIADVSFIFVVNDSIFARIYVLSNASFRKVATNTPLN